MKDKPRKITVTSEKLAAIADVFSETLAISDGFLAVIGFLASIFSVCGKNSVNCSLRIRQI